MLQFPIFPVALLLVLTALVLLWLARHQERKSGLPVGRLIYADTQKWVRVERPLYYPDLNLTGKPDYLVEQHGLIVPIEVKSSHRVKEPYTTHIYQLVAYCILVEHNYGKRPNYGILCYPDKVYAIDYTPELEEKVLSLITEMQAKYKSNHVNRSHNFPQRCAHCGYREICDQTLTI